MSDLRYALRSLVRRPLFAVTVVLTLGIGIGANGAVFSLLNAALLRPAAVAEPHRLLNVYASRADGTGHGGLSYPDYRDLAAQAGGALDAVAGYSGVIATLTGDADAEVLFGELVTGGYFGVLGVAPARGRLLSPADDAPGAGPVVVIGHGLWQRRFGGAPDVVGRSLSLNGRPYTIAGVAPERFTGSLARAVAADVWVPVSAMRHFRADQRENREERWLFVKARVRAGVGAEQAVAAVRTVGDRLAAAHPETNAGRRLLALPSSRVRVHPDADRLLAPAAVLVALLVGFVLLVACANLAGLLLARAAARRRELALRVALGAARGRLVRLLLLESGVLAALGGALGLLLAGWLSAALAAFRPPIPVPVSLDVRVDLRVALYTLLLTGASTLFLGLLPALRASRVPPAEALQAGGAHTGGRPRRWGLRNVLLVPQLACALALLVVAGLFARSVSRADAVQPGFDLEHTAVVALQLGMSGYDDPRAAAFHDRLADALRARGDVRAVALTDRVPLDLYGNQGATALVHAADGGAPASHAVQHARVSAGYFDAMGVALARGRDFTADEARAGARVAIVSAAAARQWWPDGQAVGRTLQLDADGPRLTVIGVAADAKVQSLGEAPQPFVYAPLAAGHARLLRVVVRTTGEPAALVPVLRAAVRDLDPSVGVFEATTMTEHLGVMLFPFRMAAVAGSLLGAFALVLAVVGLAGAVAFDVARRTRELGIRVALGARAADVLRLVAADGARVLAVGTVVGLLLAAALAQALGRWLFGVGALDPVTFLGVPLLIAVVVVVAAWLPARRALRVEPLTALRAE